MNSQHVRKLKIDEKIYIKTIEGFLRIHKKQNLRHRLVFAKKIDNLQFEIIQILMSSINNLIDTIRTHLSMQTLFWRKRNDLMIDRHERSFWDRLSILLTKLMRRTKVKKKTKKNRLIWMMMMMRKKNAIVLAHAQAC